MNRSLQRYSEYEYKGYYYTNGFLFYFIGDDQNKKFCHCHVYNNPENDTQVYMTDLKFYIMNELNKALIEMPFTETYLEIHSEIIRKFFPNMKTVINLDEQRIDIVKALTTKIFQRVIARYNYQVLSCILPKDIIEMLVTINNP